MQPTRSRNRHRRLAAVLLLPFAALLALGSTGACTVQADDADEAGRSDAASGTGAGAEEGSRVLARVQGQAITRTQVEERAAESLEEVRMERLQCEAKAERKRHDVLEDTTRNIVRDHLLEAEAEERGVTKDELLAEEVTSQVAEVTDADVESFYEENRERVGNRPLEQLAPQIEQYLRQQRESAAYQHFVTDLENRYDVAYAIEPYRVELDVAGEPAKGPADAPVTLVEFSDFECPFCGRVVPTLEKVEREYGDRVRIVFKQYPLRRIHPQAQKAAEASLCAHDQGKFWELHDAMFEDQEGLAVEDLKAKAAELGLDVDRFGECLDSDRYADAVEEDLREGTIAGVSGTPALFVNGRMLSGAVPYEDVAELIEQELERE